MNKQEQKDRAWKEYQEKNDLEFKEYEAITEPAWQEYYAKCRAIDGQKKILK